MIKAVLFDMDGVLIDNREMHIKAFDIWSKKHSLTLDKEKILKVFGMGNRDIFKILFNLDLTPEVSNAYSDEKEEIYRDILVKEIKPVEGLVDFLEDLKRNNILCAVGSSGITKNVDMVLDLCNIRKYFSAIINGDMLTKTKPDPEVYLKCAEALNVKPCDCIVCEDAKAGIEAARSAGMKVIALATSFKREEIEDYDYIIDDFRQISYKMLTE